MVTGVFDVNVARWMSNLTRAVPRQNGERPAVHCNVLRSSEEVERKKDHHQERHVRSVVAFSNTTKVLFFYVLKLVLKRLCVDYTRQSERA